MGAAAPPAPPMVWHDYPRVNTQYRTPASRLPTRQHPAPHSSVSEGEGTAASSAAVHLSRTTGHVPATQAERVHAYRRELLAEKEFQRQILEAEKASLAQMQREREEKIEELMLQEAQRASLEE